MTPLNRLGNPDLRKGCLRDRPVRRYGARPPEPPTVVVQGGSAEYASGPEGSGCVTERGLVASRGIRLGAAVRIGTASAVLGFMLTATSPAGAAPVSDLRARARTLAPPSSVTPVGYHVVTVPTAGFSIPVPDEWMALDTTQPLPPDATVQFSLLVEEARKSAHTRFFAVSPDLLTISIIQLFPAIDRLSAKQVRRNLAREDYRNVKIARVAIGELPARVVSVKVHGVVRPTFVTFYFVQGKRGLLRLTFATLRDGRHDPVVQTMMHGLELSG